MTQHEALISLFHEHGNVLTLGQIMQTTLAAEYRARISELRRKGWVFALERGRRPSENLYRMSEPHPWKVEGDQLLCA